MVLSYAFHELFPHEFQEAVTAVQGRAEQLFRRLEPQADRSKTPFKHKMLASIGSEKRRRLHHTT